MPVPRAAGRAVLGINTARSLTFKDGRINQEQVDFIRETFARTGRTLRDPGDPSSAVRAAGRRGRSSAASAGRSWRSMRSSRRRCRHAARRALPSRLDPDAQRSGDPGRRRLVIQAGTATSTRVREQEQSFNLIDIAEGRVTVHRPGLEWRRIRAAWRQRYVLEDGRWRARGAARPDSLTLSMHATLARGRAHGPPSDFDLDEFVRRVLAEDLGSGGDVTSYATIAADARFTAEMTARPVVVAGLEIAACLFPRAATGTSEIDPAGRDGDSIGSGRVLMRLDGNARAMLAAERSALNTLQHLSGIATLTRHYVDAIAGPARSCSTRASPGMVLRVSSRIAPVPAMASTYCRVKVAMPDKCCSVLSAGRSAASKARALPARRIKVAPFPAASPSLTSGVIFASGPAHGRRLQRSRSRRRRSVDGRSSRQ